MERAAGSLARVSREDVDECLEEWRNGVEDVGRGTS